MARADEHGRAAWIARIEALCGARGMVLTALRRQVLGLIATSPVPTTAYALPERLGHLQGRCVSLPTIYRALDFLVENGFVIRVESRNAFVPCGTPGRDRHGVLLICSRCGAADEVDDGGEVDDTLSRIASTSGFRTERQMVELVGVCVRCDGVDHANDSKPADVASRAPLPHAHHRQGAASSTHMISSMMTRPTFDASLFRFNVTRVRTSQICRPVIHELRDCAGQGTRPFRSEPPAVL